MCLITTTTTLLQITTGTSSRATTTSTTRARGIFMLILPTVVNALIIANTSRKTIPRRRRTASVATPTSSTKTKWKNDVALFLSSNNSSNNNNNSHNTINNTIRRFSSSSRLYNNNNNNNSKSPYYYDGMTVAQALHKSIQYLKENKNNDDNDNDDVIDAEYSAMYLLAFALKLPWKDGIRNLQPLLLLQNDTTAATTTKNTNNTNQRQELLLNTRVITKEEGIAYTHMVRRRKQHEPIQYIIGQWDFLDYTINVGPPLLCPRPETEELVLQIVEDYENFQSTQSTTKTTRTKLVSSSVSDRQHPGPNAVKILDVGCGTGVIGIALAAMIPNAMVTAIDIDPIAIETSMINARKVLSLSSSSEEDIANHNDTDNDLDLRRRYNAILVSAKEYKRKQQHLQPPQAMVDNDQDHDNDTYDDTYNDDGDAARGYDIIVSNPPYIPRSDMQGLSKDVRLYENEKALCGGTSPDGMDVIRTILRRLPDWCRVTTTTPTIDTEDNTSTGMDDDADTDGALCYMEVDPTQPELIRKEIEFMYNKNNNDDGGGSSGAVRFESSSKDMFGKDRFVKLRIN